MRQPSLRGVIEVAGARMERAPESTLHTQTMRCQSTMIAVHLLTMEATTEMNPSDQIAELQTGLEHRDIRKYGLSTCPRKSRDA